MATVSLHHDYENSAQTGNLLFNLSKIERVISLTKNELTLFTGETTK